MESLPFFQVLEHLLGGVHSKTLETGFPGWIVVLGSQALPAGFQRCFDANVVDRHAQTRRKFGSFLLLFALRVGAILVLVLTGVFLPVVLWLWFLSWLSFR